MPELPEVETVVRALRRPLLGRVIIGVWNDWPRHVAMPSLAELEEGVRRRQITAVLRRGKYLLFLLDDGQTLIVHLKMSGHLAVVPNGTPADKHTHTIFALDNGHELRFRDTRKFGKVYLVEEAATVVGNLGPEPLDEGFTAAVLGERLNGRKRPLKPLLLDQTIIAGVGNIYADEALFYAGLHPERRAHTLSVAETAVLHAAIQKVLRLGIEREGASIDTYTKPDGSKGEMQHAVAVFRRTGQPCRQCATPIVRVVLGGRSTHFCPVCQPKG